MDEDYEPQDFEKCPQGDNERPNEEFAEAMRQLKVEQNTSKWESAHRAVTGKGLKGVPTLLDYLRALGY